MGDTEHKAEIITIESKGVKYEISESFLGGLFVKCLDNSSLFVKPENSACIFVQSYNSLINK